MTYGPTDWLVDTAWLAENLEREDLRIVDCTTYLVPDPTGLQVHNVVSGRSDYDEGHIPGAAFVDIAAELSAPSANPRLLFSFPSAGIVEQCMGRLGIGNDSRVILYSGESMWWATRVWWVLRAYGYDNAAVLDGGLAKWKAEGRGLSKAPSAYPPTVFRAHPRNGLIAELDEVRAAIGRSDSAVIHALSRAGFEGTGPVVYGRPGRISNSINISSQQDLIDPATGTFIDLERGRGLFQNFGLDTKSRLIAYCGGGVAASALTFMLTLAGYDNVALYDNSLLEWGYDDSLPMEVG